MRVEGQARGLVRTMEQAAEAFLDSLDRDQHRIATDHFDVADHRVWTYLPGQRPGLILADMTSEQRNLALRLVDAGCSAPGGKTVRAVIELDMIRRQLGSDAGPAPTSTDHRFWIRVLGAPSGGTPWAWRVNGHHLAVHVTVVHDAVAVTPLFFGAEPAIVPLGPHQGLRTLPGEEEIARTLLARLDSAQRRVAIVAADAPGDILTRNDPVVRPAARPAGLAYANMAEEQREVLRQLVRVYFDRSPSEVAEACWQDAVDAGLDDVTFSWAGSDERGRGHYYAVRGPTFLLEYDNTQDNANHIHSVWRDLRNDWGDDLLVAHYAAHHPPHPRRARPRPGHSGSAMTP